MSIPGVTTRILDGQLGGTPPSSDGVRVIVGAASAGTVNEVVPITDVQAVRPTFGYGLLPEALSKDLSEGGGQAYAVRAAASVAGTITPGGTNPTPAITLTGTANQDLALRVKIITAGALGTSTFQFSLDGGDSWSPVIATAASYAIPNTSHTLTFAVGSYVAGDAYSWAVTAPQSSIADLQAAIRAALSQPMGFEWIHVAQPSDNSFWAAIDSLMIEAETEHRYCFAILQAPLPNEGEAVTVWAARINTMKASFTSTSKRVMVVAPAAETIDSLSGLQQIRNLSTQMSARLARYEPHINPGWVRNGPVESIVTIAPFTAGTYGKSTSYNNSVAQSLDASGFASVYTLTGRQGWYWNDGRMAVPATSDFYTVVNRRMMDRCCEEVRDVLLDFLFEGIDPTDLDASLGHMLATAEQPLRRRRARKQIAGYSVSIPPGQDLLANRTITVRVGIVPLGYPRTIYLDIGFVNPLLEGGAA